MKKRGEIKAAIVSSQGANKTSQVVKKILATTTIKDIDNLDVEKISISDLKKYNVILLGVPTWFDGELPGYWDEMVPAIENTDFKGVKVAIFGNGDQKGYPENFGDAVGLMAEIFASSGATIIGQTSTEGYTFESSKALVNGVFTGLILDFENQSNLNDSRIKNWVSSIEESFSISK